jgi:hypothetical protein
MSGQREYDVADAVAFARNYDVIVAHPWQVDDDLAAMLAANPAVRVFSYNNGGFAPSGLPGGWYALDANGNRILWKGWNTYLMNPRASGWRDRLASNCRATIANLGFHGCFLDNVGIAGASPNASRTGLPIDPATGTKWTKNAWMRDMALLVDSVGRSVQVPIAANGVGRGVTYFDANGRTSTLAGPASLVMCEQFARAATEGVTAYRNETNWKRDVDMLVDAEARGVGVLAVTKLWVAATDDVRVKWERYALATFALGAGPNSRFEFLGYKDTRDLGRPSALSLRPLGAPLGPYLKVGNVYARAFESGLAVVNPTDAAQTLPLDAQFGTLSGGKVKDELRLPARSGDVLLTI